MAKRPPLYEFMARQGDRREPGRDESAGASGHSAHAQPAPSAPEAGGLGARRSIRLPIGYLLLGAGLVCAIVAGAYVIGWARSRHVVRQEYFEDRPQPSDAPGLRAADPLSGGGGSGAAPGRDPAGAAPADDDGAESSGWGPVESDPRRPGLNYLVVAETRQEGARRLAEHLRESQLEAYVIASNNPQSRRVIVLPGLPSVAESDRQVQQLRTKVREAGRIWRARHPGESDLGDAYFLKSSG
jgi:hypothetical protein